MEDPLLRRILLLGQYTRIIPASLGSNCPLIRELLSKTDVQTSVGICDYLIREAQALLGALQQQLKSKQIWSPADNSGPYLNRLDELHLLYHGITALEQIKIDQKVGRATPQFQQMIQIFVEHQKVMLQILVQNGLNFLIAQEIFFMSGALLSKPLGCYQEIPGKPEIKDVTVIVMNSSDPDQSDEDSSTTPDKNTVN